ncbi:MAG: hypothetical protein IPM89_07685 [Candidatus Competibacteraceae bacterium]|nr:MAG: hypothetical protein IPM89_07685 [Candidatus Competibacteraceae bacterium]
MTYGCRGERISPIEIGFFTHRERDKAARDLFEKVAREVDVCVAMADATADIIRSFGSYRTEIISPGVDLAAFYPVVKLGVVGRTYATGRKGEGIVSAVMDIPRIEWHFTGHGWPGHTTSSMATSGIAWNMKPTAMFGARASWSECSVISAFNGCRVRMRPGRITRDGTCMSKPISE